jgi:hypothetical protein
MPLDYHIAIPSYGRPTIVGERTLATIERLGFEDRDRVTVYVPNWEQKQEYEEALNKKWRVEITAPGKVHSQRAYHKMYSEGTRLINMDDDIDGITILNSEGKVREYGGTLDYLVEMGFTISEDIGATLWGIHHTSNEFYMKDRVQLGLHLICGQFQGNYAGDKAICGEDRKYLASSEEDGETSIRSYLDSGSLPRIAWFSTRSKAWKKIPGGIRQELKDDGLEHREATNDVAFESFLERYPGIGRIVIDSEGNKKIRYKTTDRRHIPREIVENRFGKPVIIEK